MPDNGSRPPLVGVVMGSDSDWPVMEAASKALDEFDVPHEVDVVSAHRMPREMLEYGASAHDRGLRVVIAGAGGRGAPAGDARGRDAAARHRRARSAGDPRRARLPALDRADAGGVPVATVSIGGARNAGLLAVRILAAGEGDEAGRLRRRLIEFAAGLRDEAAAKGERLRARHTGAGLGFTVR